MLKKTASPVEVVGALLGLLILMLALLAVGMAARSAFEVFTTDADLFASAEPWVYMGIAWILLGFAGVTKALFTKEAEKRKEIILNSAPLVGLGLGHLVSVWIVSLLPL